MIDLASINLTMDPTRPVSPASGWHDAFAVHLDRLTVWTPTPFKRNRSAFSACRIALALILAFLAIQTVAAILEPFKNPSTLPLPRRRSTTIRDRTMAAAM